jgi:hypothetical protein
MQSPLSTGKVRPGTMKGVLTWPDEAGEQARVLRRIREEDELPRILVALAEHPDGLSNAQLDKLLLNNSQWRTLSHIRQVVALGFVEYQVDFFGGPGRYQLTELGKSIIPRIQSGK